MSWSQIKKTKELSEFKQNKSNELVDRIGFCLDRMDEEDNRKLFLKSLFKQARSGKSLSEKQKSYFEDIEQVVKKRHESKSAPDWDRNLWEEEEIPKKDISF